MPDSSTSEKIENLNREVCGLGKLVETGISRAVEAFLKHDRMLAERVVEEDD